jgi:hypothetical protein
MFWGEEIYYLYTIDVNKIKHMEGKNRMLQIRFVEVWIIETNLLFIMFLS